MRTSSMAQSPVKVAAVQAEPVWFDLQGSVEKACALIAEAASQGAQVIALPELFVPGYPGWIWARLIDPQLNLDYVKNSLALDSDEMRAIAACAKENGIVVVLGFAERDNGSVYIAQCVIGSDGKLLMTRRKLKPFHMERTIFGDGHAASLTNVAQTPVGKVGALSCAEHFHPLIKYNTYAQHEQIHVAAWPPAKPHPGGESSYTMTREAVDSVTRVYAMESQTFALCTTNMISQEGIEKLGTKDALVFNVEGGGCAAIYGPDGRKLSEDLPDTKEGIVYATIDLDQILRAKSLLDTCGHMNRGDLLWLGANKTAGVDPTPA